MKRKTATFVSSAVLSVAKQTASATCNWLFYQPKVPQKLQSANQKQAQR